MNTILLQSSSSDFSYFLENLFDSFLFKILIFIFISTIIGIIVGIIKEMQPEKLLSNQKNKIVNVDFTGGIIGLFLSSPKRKMNKIIAEQNQQGWKVIEIIDSEKGNFFSDLLQSLILIITIGFYKPLNGKYFVFEKDSSMLF